jgi:hypothetical protein
MGTQFLDLQNCRALLPQAHGLSLVERLEACLQGINDKDGPTHGSVRRLIRHNKKTQGQQIGSMRYLDSPIEIAQIAHVGSGWINLRAVTRPDRGPAKLHVILVYENGMTWKTIVPLQFLLKGWGDANSGHQCYVHTISHNLSHVRSFEDLRARAEADSDEFYYVGITGRNWLYRLSEHLGEMNRGSRKRFHAAWRESLGMEDVHFASSLMDINLTYEQAMKWEEVAVERFAYGPNGLNMIPGGFKGLQFLHEHRITDRPMISLEDRDRAIAEYVRRNPRKGVPNPCLAELWKDDDYYIRVIEARPKTLSAEQVRHIRKLTSEGVSIEEIAETVGALNEIQVKNVVAGRTYQRVR